VGRHHHRRQVTFHPQPGFDAGHQPPITARPNSRKQPLAPGVPGIIGGPDPACLPDQEPEGLAPARAPGVPPAWGGGSAEFLATGRGIKGGPLLASSHHHGDESDMATISDNTRHESSDLPHSASLPRSRMPLIGCRVRGSGKNFEKPPVGPIPDHRFQIGQASASARKQPRRGNLGRLPWAPGQRLFQPTSKKSG